MSREREPLLTPRRYASAAGGSAPLSPHTANNHLPTELAVLSPNVRPSWKTKLSFALVLLTETLERTALYGVVCNMVLFLNSNPMHWASYNAVDAILVLNGISYVMAIFGGWIADSCVGKFRAIVVAFVIYVGGFALWPMFSPYPFNNDDVRVPSWCGEGNGTKNLTAAGKFYYVAAADGGKKISEATDRYGGGLKTTAAPSTEMPVIPLQSENCAWAVYMSIAIISVGYGTVRANIIPFGAHQFEHEGRTAVRVYFNWFYWCINIGALVAYGVLGYVQQEQNYFWGYIAPLAVLVLALLTFLSGSCVFVKKPATGSVLTHIVRVCGESLKLC